MIRVYSHVRLTYRDGEVRIVPFVEYLTMEAGALARTTVELVTRRDAIAAVAERRARARAAAHG